MNLSAFNIKWAAYFLSCIVVLYILVLTSCKGDDPHPSRQELFLNRLAGTWTLEGGSVVSDDVVVTGAFVGMEITFSKSQTYEVLNPVAGIWPASGTFSLEEKTDGLFDLLRDDEITVNVVSLTDSKIVFQIQYNSENGRVQDVSGVYVFEMTK